MTIVLVIVAATKAYAEKVREAVATTFLSIEGQFVLTGQLSGGSLHGLGLPSVLLSTVLQMHRAYSGTCCSSSCIHPMYTSTAESSAAEPMYCGLGPQSVINVIINYLARPGGCMLVMSVVSSQPVQAASKASTACDMICRNPLH